MKGAIIAALESWLAKGNNRIGEITIVKNDGGFVLRHYADVDATALEIFTEPADARVLSQYDAWNEYRPLKSAPNLKRGWELRLRDLDAVRAALDFFYPAAIGQWVAYQRGELAPVPFRETAERQTGMYAVVKKISNDQADVLAGDFCKSDGACLKTILWKLDAATPITHLPASKFDSEADQCGIGGNFAPLLCSEACNLFVAAARSVVKGERP